MPSEGLVSACYVVLVLIVSFEIGFVGLAIWRSLYELVCVEFTVDSWVIHWLGSLIVHLFGSF